MTPENMLFLPDEGFNFALNKSTQDRSGDTLKRHHGQIFNMDKKRKAERDRNRVGGHKMFPSSLLGV